MSRSAKDATRFTQTAPHAYTRSGTASASRSGPSFQSGAPPAFRSAPVGEQPIASSGTGETPSQRVARLRAEHIRRRMAQMTTWDKVVVGGRRVADTLHVWTVFGLLSLSVVTAGITIFSLGDMILYNRRKKKDFTSAYQKLLEQRYDDALKAEANGTATETQLGLIKQERDAQEFYAKKQERGWWDRAKGAFSTKGLSKDAAGTQSWADKQEILDNSNFGSSKANYEGSEILAAVDEQRRAGEKELELAGYSGGSLDQMAQRAAEKAESELGSGLSVTKWFMWGSKKPGS